MAFPFFENLDSESHKACETANDGTEVLDFDRLMSFLDNRVRKRSFKDLIPDPINLSMSSTADVLRYNRKDLTRKASLDHSSNLP